MNDTTLDLMFERASERLWEEQNKPFYDDEMLRKIEEPMRSAVKELEMAIENANLVAEELADTPLGDRVVSIVNGLEDLLGDLRAKQKEMGVKG